jgi:hypothetical protein
VHAFNAEHSPPKLNHARRLGQTQHNTASHLQRARARRAQPIGAGKGEQVLRVVLRRSLHRGRAIAAARAPRRRPPPTSATAAAATPPHRLQRRWRGVALATAATATAASASRPCRHCRRCRPSARGGPGVVIVSVPHPPHLPHAARARHRQDDGLLLFLAVVVTLVLLPLPLPFPLPKHRRREVVFGVGRIVATATHVTISHRCSTSPPPATRCRGRRRTLSRRLPLALALAFTGKRSQAQLPARCLACFRLPTAWAVLWLRFLVGLTFILLLPILPICTRAGTSKPAARATTYSNQGAKAYEARLRAHDCGTHVHASTATAVAVVGGTPMGRRPRGPEGDDNTRAATVGQRRPTRQALKTTLVHLWLGDARTPVGTHHWTRRRGRRRGTHAPCPGVPP